MLIFRKLICVLVFLGILQPNVWAQTKTSDSLVYFCQKFNELNTKVRNQEGNKLQHKKDFARLLAKITAFYSQEKKDAPWTFPVEGYGAKAIGGKNGNGYQPRGYSYFDGNRHTAHPAHDIFIQDKNQDALDDRTGKPVRILSVSSGVVIATENVWESQSKLRGGKYVWVFDVANKKLYYYAHNQEIEVEVGQQIKSGQAIAQMGRTGLNAFKKRSPTHLHFMALRLSENYVPSPTDTYQKLRVAAKP
jgi:murein DD-endopeptidase MepM/ murein hydrolase activator NlpD